MAAPRCKPHFISSSNQVTKVMYTVGVTCTEDDNSMHHTRKLSQCTQDCQVLSTVILAVPVSNGYNCKNINTMLTLGWSYAPVLHTYKLYNYT